MQKLAYIYLPEQFADWETGYLAAVLKTGELLREGAWDVRIVGESGKAVSSMGGLSVTPDVAATDLPPASGDLLVLCGGESWDEGRHRPILDLTAEWMQSGKCVAAICGSTVALARSGLLEHTPHTSNDLSLLKSLAPSYKGERYYSAEPAVRHGNLVTATGAAPVAFTAFTLLMIGAFTPQIAEAWTALYSRQDPSAYARLMELLQG